jgi:hypothetical protein
MASIDVSRSGLLQWLRSEQCHRDYSQLPTPLPSALGGPEYRLQLVPIMMRGVSRTFMVVNDDRR